MYDWGKDGVYDNNENRDVTITFTERFYHPDGFRDPAMIYSPITLSSVARDAKSSAILDAMLSMPNHEIKQSRKEDLRPKNLREIVAFNPNISHESIRYLLSFNDERIKSFLACNSAINVDAQILIFQNANQITKLMLTQNDNLDDTIFVELLKSNEEIIHSLLTFQKLTSSRLKAILKANLNKELLVFMGENQQIKEVMLELIGLHKSLDHKLAANHQLNQKALTALYEQYGDEFMNPLSSNPNLDPKLLELFYAKGDERVLVNIASNSSTPQAILDALAEKNIHTFNRALALNPATKLSYLEQFALDYELMMLMKKNSTYLESINAVHTGRKGDDRY